MLAPALPLRARTPSRTFWFMAAAWSLIIVKCLLVTWAIGRWQIPVHPMWIVAPTLVCAALATLLWLAHRGD